MKATLLTLITLHGFIHLIGFARAFNLAPVTGSATVVSKRNGIFWFVAAVLFLYASLLWFVGNNLWIFSLFIGVLTSQYVLFKSWKDAKWGSILNIIILLSTVVGYASWKFYTTYKNQVRLEIIKSPVAPDSILSENDLRALPELVQKYVRYTGAVGKPKVRNFKLEFAGHIRKNEESEWMPFHSEQYNFLTSSTRLFFMNATMKNLPVSGFHGYKNGQAFMDIRLLSLFRVQHQSGKEMGIAETVTFFNDMCCMAPATLIDKRIKWLETADHKVKAQFTNNGISVSAWLYFNDQGELINFISNDRFAAEGSSTMKQLPWSTPLRDYKYFNNRRLPGYAETIYTYPKGNFVYGNFTLQYVEYNCNEIQ